VQIANPWYKGGANAPALVQAQRAFTDIGAMEKRFLSDVRAPRSSDPKDPEWRPLLQKDKNHVTTPREIEEQRKTGVVIPYEYWKRS